MREERVHEFEDKLLEIAQSDKKNEESFNVTHHETKESN